MRKYIIYFILLFAVVGMTSCVQEDKAIRAVQAMGMTNVTITGYRVYGCSEDDDFHTGFSATNARGERVTGVVCSGIMKGATVRLD